MIQFILCEPSLKIKESNTIFQAVEKVLSEGWGTKDIASEEGKILSTGDLAHKVIQYI